VILAHILINLREEKKTHFKVPKNALFLSYLADQHIAAPNKFFIMMVLVRELFFVFSVKNFNYQLLSKTKIKFRDIFSSHFKCLFSFFLAFAISFSSTFPGVAFSRDKTVDQHLFAFNFANSFSASF
jgi:hypothetical protein